MLLLRLLLLAVWTVPVRAQADFRVAGYLPDYRFDVDLEAKIPYLDDIYLFSLSPQTQLGDQMFDLCCLNDSHFEKARNAVRNHPKTKLWVTVGGGGRSHKFLNNPSAMLRSIRKVLNEQGLHGVDFNNEELRTHKDYADYASFIRNTANLLHQEGYQVSVALHAGQLIDQSVYKSVDRVNLMTYDMQGASYHADFGKMREAIDKLVHAGCPKEKILVGLPAYGRHKHTREPETYSTLADHAMQHENVGLQGLSKLDDINDYLVDSSAAVQAKVRYIQAQGLGGIFFWELGQDKVHADEPAGILLSTASRQARSTEIPQDSQQHEEL